MSAFTQLLRSNRNYRSTWTGQIVSEIGDHFNNIAVMSLAMEHVNPGIVVTGVFLSRAVPMLAAGPIAGVLLDRLDRKRVMIASDLTRAILAFGFILCIQHQSLLLLYALSAGLMFASPFFTSGRSSILPSITTPEELHVANTMTQTTSWASLTLGAFLGAAGAHYGYRIAFAFNALSFIISALCISVLRRPGGFRNLSNYAAAMLQPPFLSPSVFNYYPPNFQVQGTSLRGPEFAILNANTTVTRVNFINDLIYGKVGPNTTTNISSYVSAASNVPNLSLCLTPTSCMARCPATCRARFPLRSLRRHLPGILRLPLRPRFT